MQNIDEKVLYERAKLILSIYREVCWSTIDRANDVCDTLICTYGDSLDGALIYLENFAPDEARERFEERIRSLFETNFNCTLRKRTYLCSRKSIKTKFVYKPTNKF